MQNDNTTPMSASVYDKEISKTIPYYEEFHTQAISVIRAMQFGEIDWLDLGCGTGTLANKAVGYFEHIRFVMADPSEKMLEQAKVNNPGLKARYLHCGSEDIVFDSEFHVVTAIQSHHYMRAEARERATEKIYRALRESGIYITFENVVPEEEAAKEFELRRWAAYQRGHGKSEKEVSSHIARCGVHYFPLTIRQHIELLRAAGFRTIHLFWCSYMQAGLYAVK